MAAEILENYTQSGWDVDTDIDHEIKHGFLTIVKDTGLGCILPRVDRIWANQSKIQDPRSCIRRICSNIGLWVTRIVKVHTPVSIIEAICDQF